MVSKEKSAENAQFRSFGLMVGGIFAIIGAWPLLVRGEGMRTWALCLAGVMLASALLFPSILSPVYRAWMWLGAILGWFNTRVILAIGYFLVFTPIGWLMSLMGKDPLRLKFDPTERTYRVLRDSRPGMHMERQF